MIKIDNMDEFPIFTATAAKQRFGELLECAGHGPAGIVSHGRILACVVPPDRAAPASASAGIDAMLRARAVQTDKDGARRRDHLAFVKIMRSQERVLARAAVARWETEKLCSPAYIEAWRALLALPRAALRRKLDARDDLTRVLLANSPLTPLIAQRKR